MPQRTPSQHKSSSQAVIDIGPRERAHHQGGLRLGARVQTEAGIVLHQGAAASMECVLDALRDTGLLDGREGTKQDRATVGRSRYEQGVWLRCLFMRAGLNALHAMDLSTRSGTHGINGVADLPDDAARARMKYNRIIRELGPFGDAVTSFVCFDQFKRGEQHLAMLRKGLDRLCVVRG